MKKAPKKIALRRETLCRLEAEPLHGVAAGYALQPSVQICPPYKSGSSVCTTAC